ncbi:hypothetical protein MKEN_00924700 [Mycena kentingensis (nom. inval.)]|nr:hypothetical protein MKEN_00924700 [Mycena kentingensis (nom. inval.)]
MTGTLQVNVEFNVPPLPPQTFVANRWRIPNNTLPFGAFPASAANLSIKDGALFMNMSGDLQRGTICPKAARKWGILWEEERIIFARAEATNGALFCFRFLFNAEAVTRKSSFNYKHYKKMLDDAAFYSKHGTRAAGLFVPVHYGLWVMETGNFGGMVLFSITQWCGESWATLLFTKFNTEANRILLGRTLEMAHDVGFNVNGRLDDLHHLTNIVVDLSDPHLSLKDKQNGRGRCYFTDLSDASLHKCGRKLPMLPFRDFVPQNVFGCAELANAACLLHLMPIENTQPSGFVTSDAIDWYEKYAAEHAYLNSSLLIAQRKKLFDGQAAVYPGIRVSFDEEEEDEFKARLQLSYKHTEAPFPPETSFDVLSLEDLASAVLGSWLKVASVKEFERSMRAGSQPI